MKMMMSVALVLWSLNGYAQSVLCDYYNPQCATKYKTYVDGVKTFNELAEEKLITQLAGRKQVLKLAQSMFPKDALLISIANQQVTLATVLATSNLSSKQKEEIEQAASATYSNALAERFAMLDAAKEIGDQAVAARPQSRPAPQVVYVEGNSAVNDAIPAAMFLNKIGQAFSNSYNQYLIPMTTCNSWGKGSVTCY